MDEKQGRVMDENQVALIDDNQGSLLEKTPVSKLIWKLSIPSVIGILSYNLYHIINTIYISRGVGVFAAGGLAITLPLFIFLSALSSTMGAGAASIISRAIGNKELERANKVAANTFVVFWTMALLITIIGLCYLEEMLYAMGVTDKLLPYAKEYSRIILIGAITSTGFSSLIRAEGSSRYAMYQWIIPVAANMVLDPIFIFLFHQGVQGAAIATVISQCISVAMFIYYFFFSGRSSLKLRPNHFLPDVRVIGEILIIGMPSFIQLASQSLTIVIINNVLRKYGGDLNISTYGITNRITVVLLIPLQGIVQGIQPIIGYNYGAGIKTRVGETLKSASIIAGCYGLIISFSTVLLSKLLLYPFTSDEEIVQIGSGILKITCLGLVFSGIHMMQLAYFQAIGKSKIALILSLCNYILCFVPILLVLSSLFGVKGIWLSFPLSGIITLAISSICVINQTRRENIK